MEYYPTFAALSYEFWAYAYMHPVLVVVYVYGLCYIIVSFGDHH
jgi:hypothetical protein